MAKREQQLKSLLMKVKEECEKAGLKLNIQKMKIMASSPIISWQIDGETVETVRDFIFLNTIKTPDGAGGGARGSWGPFLTPPLRLEEKKELGASAIVARRLCLPYRTKPVSRVRLCATPYTAAHQAPPSLGFSRQEHGSGVPFPSPMHESGK